MTHCFTSMIDGEQHVPNQGIFHCLSMAAATKVMSHLVFRMDDELAGCVAQWAGLLVEGLAQPLQGQNAQRAFRNCHKAFRTLLRGEACICAASGAKLGASQGSIISAGDAVFTFAAEIGMLVSLPKPECNFSGSSWRCLTLTAGQCCQCCRCSAAHAQANCSAAITHTQQLQWR